MSATLTDGLIIIAAACLPRAGPPATGLRLVHPTHPRSLADASGKAVYLIGSHVDRLRVYQGKD